MKFKLFALIAVLFSVTMAQDLDLDLDLDYYESQEQFEASPRMSIHDRRRRLDHSTYNFNYSGSGYGYYYSGYSGYSGNMYYYSDPYSYYSDPYAYYVPEDNWGTYYDPYCECDMDYATAMDYSYSSYDYYSYYSYYDYYSYTGYYYSDYYQYSNVYYSYYSYYYDFYQNYDYDSYYYAYSYSQSDGYYPSTSNEHKYYGFYGVYSSSNALPSTYQYNFNDNYGAVYNSSRKSIFTAAHANVDITHFVFQADEFVSMGAAISQDYAWITNPSCDGTNYVWNNKAGDQQALKAVFHSDGYSINYFEVGRNVTNSSCDPFDGIYFDNWNSIGNSSGQYVSGQLSNPSCDGVNFVFDNFTGNPVNFTA